MATIVFSPSTIPANSIPENATGDTVVGTLSVSGGETGEAFSFVLTDPNFEIADKNNDGVYELRVKDGVSFDFEDGLRQFDLTIQAMSANGTTLVDNLPVQIDVTNVNERPDFEIDDRQVPEGALPGTIVYTLVADDPDGDVVTYQLSEESEAVFDLVDNKDGTWSVVVDEAVTWLEPDNDAHDRFTVAITHGSETYDSELFIQLVANEEPEISFEAQVIGRVAQGGTIVGVLTAVDPEGHQITYTLSDESKELFELTGNANGTWSVRVKAGVTLDYTNEDHQSFTVTGNDNFNDVEGTHFLSFANEPPVVDFEAKDVVEGARAGTVVATFTATDSDGDDIDFTLSTTSANVFEIVKIDGDTWNVIVKEGIVLDYDNVAHQSFTVTISDGHNPDTAEYDLTVEDNQPPAFTVEARTVRENAPAGTIVGTIDASDPEDDRLGYSLGGASAHLFHLVEDTATGRMNIVLRAGAVLNYENNGHHSLEVLVSDGINESVSETLSLEIADVNEDPVVTFATAGVNEGAGAGTVVGTLTGTDEDGDDVTFTLSDDSAELFDLVADGRGGFNVVVLEGVTLDYENAAHRSVRVSATGGEKELSRTFALSLNDLVDVVTGTKRGDTLKGGVGSDIVKGLAGNDRLSGGVGDDWLYGGAGRDVLNGDGGRDIFVFDTKPNKKTNLDVVWDYNVQDDSIWLENKVFTKLGKSGSATAPAALKKSFFKVGDKAKDKDDYLIYNMKTGYLSYDADGSGSKAAVEIALLKKGLAMKATEFFVT